MQTRLVVGREDVLWLERAPLPEAHGAEGLRFPEGEAAPSDEERGVWEARGDVQPTPQRFVRRRGDAPRPGLERWTRDALRRAWAAGEVVLAPTVPPLAFDDVQDLGARVQAWEVGPGVRMLPVRTATLPPATHTNTFLVGDDVVALVEPAPRDEGERALLARWLEEARRDGRRPRAVLATHHHPDHVAPGLAEALGLPLWAHAETAARVDGAVARTLRDGERVGLGERVLEALHTPGHAPGHLCFLEPETRLMIVGDMLAGVGTILVEPRDGDMGRYLRSLQAMKAREPRGLLPAHGGLLADPAARIDHYVAHRLMREEKVAAALRAHGPASVRELVPHAYDDAPKAVWGLAAMSLEAHLLKLEADDRAARDGSTWRAC
ncbi:MAG TPA: MBL fold metallo-hydrolase [Polyangiaceae bacterium LLY-WYZ-15_(1-7)]|nr:MBL fold metallo-hydrolase [Polyangiaceae bacterium LLY-WYZ-15_(1-7)]HJL09536.1 MBL fold metallo-hydrolase [Polyangiaceae bacterium LLY-WYZ-15_(1-7)]HJL35198.1 MBL fold metallo-hydrolase [Polyangiaceae bacterium LLY-WYZ-15_(1-7)]